MSTTAPKALPEAIQYCPTTSWNKIQSEEILLLDVRETQEVEQLHFDVPNYLNIPLSLLEERFAEVPQEMQVIVASLEGTGSLKATYYLLYQGYSQVANMKLGLTRWVAKGFPVIGDPAAIHNGTTGSCCPPADTESCCS
ncbi:MAG TPA: rhodanese-like domain-containing protein [Psychromonas sp.]